MNLATNHAITPLTKLAVLGSIAASLFVLSERMAHSFLLTMIVLAISVVGGIARIGMLQRERRDEPMNHPDHAWLSTLSLAVNAPWIKAQLRGHDEGVDRICAAVDRGLLLADSERPLAAFLLAGPTGTGKTYFAELAARALFGDQRFVNLALNQLKDSRDGEYLIEHLQDRVAEDPHRVILLDEVDKAHPEVLHALYEILDKGRCRSRKTGRIVSFSGTVIFATSNSGVEGLRTLRERLLAEDTSPATLASRWIGGARDAIAQESAMDASFLARWDDVILMDELPGVRAAEVACLSIARHWEKHGLRVLFSSPELVLSLVRGNREFSRYGVRQLQQLIRSRSDGAILAARAEGFNVLHLGLGPSGEFVLQKAGRG